MKKLLISLLLMLYLPLFLTGCTNRDNKSEKCRKEQGIWYGDICVTEDSTDKILKKLRLIEEKKTDQYEITVYYPYQVLKYPDIYNRLKNTVSDIKKEESYPVQEQTVQTESYPWQLKIDMREFRSGGNFASILIYSMSYTGGAHPNHYYESLNFNTENQKIVNLDDLFSNAKYINEISQYVTSALLRIKSKKTGENIDSDEWIERGALPLSDNFQIFIFIPNKDHTAIEGIKFIFPPYTVGPYSDGTYEVFVPVKIFSKYLKDDIRDSFI